MKGSAGVISRRVHDEEFLSNYQRNPILSLSCPSKDISLILPLTCNLLLLLFCSRRSLVFYTEREELPSSSPFRTSCQTMIGEEEKSLQCESSLLSTLFILSISHSHLLPPFFQPCRSKGGQSFQITFFFKCSNSKGITLKQSRPAQGQIVAVEKRRREAGWYGRKGQEFNFHSYLSLPLILVIGLSASHALAPLSLPSQILTDL